MLQRRVIF